MPISIYKDAYDKTGADIPLDMFLQRVQDGYWQDAVLKVRVEQNEQKQKKLKEKVPAVTISGKFREGEQSMSGLVDHSGFICIDIDNLEDINHAKSLLCADRHVYACFTSIRGHGLAVIFRINPRKHLESFLGLEEYLFTNYQVVVDASGKNVNRLRFVSFDPHIYINESAVKFTQYPKAPPPALKKLPQVVFVQSDFDSLMLEISQRHIDITGSYHEWMRIGFAISEKFGESGRGAYHVVSQFHPKYSPAIADKQYTNCLKHQGSGVTIATLYWYAKQAGLTTTSERTRLVSSSAYRAKKGRMDRADVVAQLAQFEDIPAAESQDIVNQVYDNNIVVESDDSLLSEIETWLRHNYNLRRNSLTRKLECGDKVMEARDFNTIFIAARKVFDKANFEMIDRIINSDFTPDYNPLVEWFAAHSEREATGAIAALSRTILTDADTAYVERFVTKWLIGIVMSAHGEPSPLMLVLSGSKQGTGKTEWFRRLLPRDIRSYYAESKLDAGKDDDLLMCTKLIVMDDEMGGKSKKEAARLKELTSKKWFSLREPYGRHNVDLRRLAVLAGTTNDNQILNDPTGNRRVVPINVIDIDKEAYNKIDKTDVLMEAYRLWKAGGTCELNREEIEELNNSSESFVSNSIEYDLIAKYYVPPTPMDNYDIEFLTTTDVKVKLEQWTGQRLSLKLIGMELKRLGFVRVRKQLSLGYYMIEKGKKAVTENNGWGVQSQMSQIGTDDKPPF